MEPGKEYQRDDGSVGVSYNVKKVFDISQTRVAQRPAPAVVRDERLLLKALMNNAPCRFAISNELPEGVNVAYHPQEHTVYIRQGLDAPTIFRGLAQELARAHMDRDEITCESPDFTAYSVSYMLCRRNGVPVEGFSFRTACRRAMPGWTPGRSGPRWASCGMLAGQYHRRYEPAFCRPGKGTEEPR